MKSMIYGGLTVGTLILTSLAHSPFGIAHDKTKNPAIVPSHSEDVGHNQAEGKDERNQATSMAAVGWKGCHWCEKLKTDTLRPLTEEGYDVRYLDKGEWKGPEVKTGPTLFFFNVRGKIVHTHQGFMTVDEVKEILNKPSLGQ